MPDGGASGRKDVGDALTDLSREMLIAGVNAPAFGATNSAIALLCPLDTQDKKIAALGEAFSSDSWLIQRYVCHREVKLDGKHRLFMLLKPILYLDGVYFGAAAALRKDNTIPPLARNFVWGEKEQIAGDSAAVAAGVEGKSVRFGA